MEKRKNCWLIPTDKPSKLFIIDKSKMYAPELPYLSFSTVGGKVHKIEGSELYQPQFIYITNEESLTLGGYHFNSKYGDEPQKTNKRDIDSRKYWEEDDYYISKIILTNDPKLIADGVQELTEEQLKEIVSRYPLDYIEVKHVIKEYVDEQDAYGYDVDYYSLVFNPFFAEKEKTEKLYTKEQIINTMHQVELEDDKDYSKLFNRVLQKLNEL